MKKYLLYIFVLIGIVGIVNSNFQYTIAAQSYADCALGIEANGGSDYSNCTGLDGDPTQYKLLAPLPCPAGSPGCDSNGQLTSFDPSSHDAKNTKLGEYLNLMIKIVIGLAAVMAMVMIIIGGFEYMTSELISNKESGKDKIKDALLGLLLTMGAYALLNTINPQLLKSDIQIETATVEMSVAKQVKFYTGQGTCEAITDSSNPCSPENLTKSGFSNGVQASSICKAESEGEPKAASGTDMGSDGNSFSFGLFQINILAHANEIPGGVCSGIFTVDPNPAGKIGTNAAHDKTLGGCLEKDVTGKVCVKYAAVVTDKEKYKSCVKYITDPTNNISYASKLQKARNWNQWGANASCHF